MPELSDIRAAILGPTPTKEQILDRIEGEQIRFINLQFSDVMGIVKTVPGSLREVLAALEADHEFLLEGDVFSRGFIDNWIAYKLENEVEPANLRISPYEFYLYFDV